MPLLRVKRWFFTLISDAWTTLRILPSSQKTAHNSQNVADHCRDLMVPLNSSVDPCGPSEPPSDFEVCSQYMLHIFLFWRKDMERVGIPLVSLTVTAWVTVLTWNHVDRHYGCIPATQRTLATAQQGWGFQEGKKVKQLGKMLRHLHCKTKADTKKSKCTSLAFLSNNEQSSNRECFLSAEAFRPGNREYQTNELVLGIEGHPPNPELGENGGRKYTLVFSETMQSGLVAKTERGRTQDQAVQLSI